MKRKYRYRSAKTGRFISKAEYEANPDTTVRELIRKPFRVP